MILLTYLRANGESGTVKLADSRLDELIARSNNEFGSPGVVLEIPAAFPEPSKASLCHWEGRLK